MRKGLVLLIMVGIIALSFSYQILAAPMASTNGFSDHLIPTQLSTMFFEKKVTLFLTTKMDMPDKMDDQTGWMVGIDTDMNKNTGGKWPKIGADYILSVISQNGKWETSIKNVKTGAIHGINAEVMMDKNKVDFSVPLTELENKTEFNWQIAVVSGNNKKALPDVITASKKNQKDNETYDDTMKKMKM